MGALGDLLQTLTQLVPWWLLAPLVLLVAALAVPGWLTGLRIKQVKAKLRRTVRAEGEARRALLDEAWRIADGSPEVLLALAREADKLNLPSLRDRAFRDLERRGTHADALRQLRRPSSPNEERPIYGHPVQAAVAIERLLDNGAVEAARLRLGEALARFPDDPQLLALRERADHLPRSAP